ncbi:MAG: hypothetical protein SGJ05_01945 [bacterium]|nr:hypothetical protein [bacterium]
MDTFRFAFAAGPWWLYVVLVLAATGVAVWSYRYANPDPGPRMRVLLIALRSLGLALLLITLFEPLIRITRSDEMRPRVAVAIDVSKSDTLNDAAGNRATSVRTAIKTLLPELESAGWSLEDVDLYLFDESVRSISRDTLGDGGVLQFRGLRTDIAAALRGITNRSEDANYGAVVMITDGNTNTGEAPLYVAERSAMGVYSVGIGDSVPPKDVAVLGILTNTVGYVGRPLAVTAEVNASNTGDASTTVVLLDNGREVARETLALRRGFEKQSVNFSYTPTEAGMHKLTVSADGIAGEFTARNNTLSDFVKVLKDARTVVLIAGAPSPDVTFIKAALAADPTITVSTHILKQGTEFYEGPPSASVLGDAQAVVLIGFPTASAPQNVIDMVATAARNGCSMLFIPSVATDYRRIDALADILPFRVASSRPQEFQVTADVKRNAINDPILKLTGTDTDAATWSQLPPIFRTETFVTPAPGAEVLATLRVNNAPLEEPLILKRETDRSRSVAIMGYGLHRWKLLAEGPRDARGEARGLDILATLMGNTVRWLSVRDDDKRVRIRPSRLLYASGENVTLHATVQDASYAPVDAADVRVRITASGGAASGSSGVFAARDVVLPAMGNGRYSLDLGQLPIGDYSYSGKAGEYGSDQGRFSVGDVSLEDGATYMNAALLHAMSDRTGGAFATPNGIPALVDRLKNDARMRPVAMTSDREIALWQLVWLLAAAIACFAVEWTVRKRRGLV